MNLTSISSTSANTRSSSAQSGGESTASQVSNEFITLLSAQMINQDPSDPMKSHELTAQLAQVASLEQQEGTNKLMQTLISVVGTQGNFAALNIVGKEAKVVLTDFSYDGKETLSGELYIDDANKNDKFTVQVKDSAGLVVKEMEVEVVDGKATWEWDGTDHQGDKLPEGDYNISAFQESETGEKLDVAVTTSSVIESINFSNGMINMENGTEIPFGNIISVAAGSDEESISDSIK